ncbi:MAG TPA: hypothetical protein VIM44_08505 [Rariglobus sp.]
MIVTLNSGRFSHSQQKAAEEAVRLDNPQAVIFWEFNPSQGLVLRLKPSDVFPCEDKTSQEAWGFASMDRLVRKLRPYSEGHDPNTPIT